ncbi:MAG: universal stress protein [Geminicoccaceae bacterium]
MAYKDLLVQIDDTKACESRIEAAIDLAGRFDAHLTGLYLVPEIILPVAATGYIGADLYGDIQQQEEERAEAALDRFRQAATAKDVEFDTRIDQGPIADFPALFSVHSRYADLSIIGQTNHEDTVPSTPEPQDVVMTSGAPVLITPYIGASTGFGGRVMVAWNASREAARAVRDAMPLLERSQSVDLVIFRPNSSQSAHGELPGADIALHLTRHGIDVDVQQLDGTDIDVGNALLSHIADRGSDLLVMGGYGHSRLREFVLGGATRTILRSMTLPVLMAH